MSDNLFPIELFESGTYSTVSGAPITFADADLDEIVANFQTLKPRGIKPPLQLGHGEQQVLLQGDGQPALGWVEDVQRQGSKLIAYVADVPQALKDLIKGRRYNRVSAGFNLAWQRSADEQNLKSGVTGKVLEHAALLGADLPQVKTLADLATFLCSTAPLHASTRAVSPDDCVLALAEEPAPLRSPDDGSPADSPVVADDTKEPIMADPKTPDDVAALSTRLAALEAEKQERLAADKTAAEERATLSTKLAETEAELSRLRASEASARQEARLAAGERFADGLCQATSMKIAPAQKPWAAALHAHLSAAGDGVAIAKGDAERLQCASAGDATDLTAMALLKGFMDAAPDQKALLSLVPRTRTTGAAALEGDDYEAALAHVAQDLKLNLKVADERAQAAIKLVELRPQFRTALN